MRRTAEDVITIGQALIRQNENLKGHFKEWVATEFEMSDRTARSFMSVARRYGGRPETVSGVTISALYELAAPSTPPEVQAEVERRIAPGELVGTADIKALKAEAKAAVGRAADLERKSDSLEERNRDLVANAHSAATREAERRFRSLLDDAEERALVAEQMAQASVADQPVKAAVTNIVDLASEELKSGRAVELGYLPWRTLCSRTIRSRHFLRRSNRCRGKQMTCSPAPITERPVTKGRAD